VPTEAKPPRELARGGKASGAGAAVKRRPAVRSARALQMLLEELGAARAMLDDAMAALRAVDARLGSWDRSGADGCQFLARRARALHDEATTRFARSLEGLHGLLVRLADRSAGPAFSARLRSPATRRLQARVRQQLRTLHRAFDGGGALLSRSIATFE
jgi:hypothetical protein